MHIGRKAMRISSLVSSSWILKKSSSTLKSQPRMFRAYPFIQNTERLDFQLGRKIKD